MTVYPDMLGVEIKPDDELVIASWWPGRVPKFLVGSAARMIATTPQGSVKIDVGGRVLSAPSVCLGVVNRETGHGWEGNRLTDAGREALT